MFKKLVNLLFEEEEIEDFESEYEEEETFIEIRQKKTEPELPKKVEPVTLKQEKPKAEPEVKQEEVKIELPKEEKPVETKPQEPKGIMIDLDPVKETKVSVPKFTQKRETEYEFSRVISPIYGILDDEKTTVSELASPAVKRKVVPNSSLLGTVISPIYGVTRDTKNSMTPNRVVLEEEMENVSLDDLLKKPEPKHASDLFEFEHQKREEDPNDLDSLIRSLSENEPEKVVSHRIVESQLNLFDDEE